MTEASTSETLTRAVALCAMALRSTARTRLLKLLPENMAAGVEDWLRDPAVLAAGATSAVESALLHVPCQSMMMMMVMMMTPT